MDTNDTGPGTPGIINTLHTAGWGFLRLTLLFGTAAIALSVMLSPMLQKAFPERQAASMGQPDPVVTGSVDRAQRAYRVRRSILQDDLSEPCIIYANGSQSGNCR